MTEYDSIKAYLDATRTTQEQLAKELRISQGHMSKLVNRKEQPSMTLAAKLNTKYGIVFEGMLRRRRTARAA